MARASKKSVYERIELTLSEIAVTEQKLAELKSLLNDLYVEKDELEMKLAWETIKKNGLGIEDIQKLLEKKNK